MSSFEMLVLLWEGLGVGLSCCGGKVVLFVSLCLGVLAAEVWCAYFGADFAFRSVYFALS